MTLVVARKFGDRIAVMSDTMISDFSKIKPDAIPGTLKSLVLDLHLTVSYAGIVEIAISAIRRAKCIWTSSRNLETVLSYLLEVTQEDACEFIVTAHTPSPRLHVIKRSNLSVNLDVCWIGDRTPIGKMQLLSMPNDIELPAWQSADEFQFTSAFSALFARSAQINECVGGVPVNQISSPVGHAYQSILCVSVTDITHGSWGTPEAERLAREFEQHDYKFNSVAPDERGVALFAIHMPQANAAYIHSPLEWDQPKKLEGVNLTQVRNALKLHAERLGGVVID